MFNKRLNNVYLISLWHLLFFWLNLPNMIAFIKTAFILYDGCKSGRVSLRFSFLLDITGTCIGRCIDFSINFMFEYLVWGISWNLAVSWKRNIFSPSHRICQFLLERRLLKTFACCSETFTVLGSFSKCQQRIAFFWIFVNLAETI